MDKKKKDKDDIEIEQIEELANSFGKDGVKKLKEKLKACQKERQEFLEGWQRAKADFINARKEDEKKRAELADYVKTGFISELLPAIESFEMAFENKEAWEKVDPDWRKGVEYIHAQFAEVLKNHGLKEIGEEGEDFDPEKHESVEVVETEEKQNDGKIAEVCRLGYEVKGKTIRPAKVKVFSYSTKGGSASG